MKKKYLFLMITEHFAGAEHLQLDYLKFIDYDKYSVTLGTMMDVFSPHLKKHNLPVDVVDLPILEEEDRFWGKFIKFYKCFKAARPDCIVFNQFWLKSFTLAELMAAFIVTRGNVYMIVHDCPPVFPRYKRRKRYFKVVPGLGLSWRRARLLQTLLGYVATHTIAVSKAAQDALVSGHKFPVSKVELVYHGVDTHAFSPSRDDRRELRQGFSVRSSDIVIVSTAMLWPGKRVDRLVEAFATVAQERHDIHLLVAGTGSEYSSLINMVHSLDRDIAQRIRFLEYRDDISRLLQLSDIYVLPSDSEGLSIACLEAMACGLVSIVTNSGGPAEIIRDGYNGFLVEKSHEGIVSGLRGALNLTPAEREEMSRNARRFVEEKFDLERNIRTGFAVLKLGAPSRRSMSNGAGILGS